MKTKVIARIYVKNEFIDAFKELAATMVAKTGKESGCLFYRLFQDVSRPGDFLFYEEYKDQSALDVHRQSEYLKDFRENNKHMLSQDALVEVI
ncbi:MAG: antibiotic biosynthesis monooxygenase [Candidatus Omnitrophica bacterium]|nr:antibiotic biosynthesis monooxygenase [Candidatus Omnitrophota bacterium]